MTQPTYQVIKGLPITARTGVKGQPKFPFAELEIGDCFFVPLQDITEGAARNQCSRWSKRLKRRFRVRQFDQCLAQFWREA